jgi:hypothetical protein
MPIGEGARLIILWKCSLLHSVTASNCFILHCIGVQSVGT